MIIVLFMIFAIFAGALVHYLDKLGDNYCWTCNQDNEISGNKAIRAKKSFYTSGWIYTGLMLCIYSIVVCTSYDNYVDDRAFLDATMEQYEGAIDLYEEHGVINLEKAAKMALTDHKYEGYQENMAEFVKALRYRVTKYNKSIVSKRIVGKNLFFSWFIVMPDDNMQVLKIYKKKSGGCNGPGHIRGHSKKHDGSCKVGKKLAE